MRRYPLAGWLALTVAVIGLLLARPVAVLAGFTPTPTDTVPATATPTATATGVGPTPTNTSTPTSTGVAPIDTPTPPAITVTDVPPPNDTGTGFGNPFISKSANVQVAQVGDPVDFTLTVTNRGDVSVLNVVVVDRLPAELNYRGATPGQGTASFDTATNTLTINIGTLGPAQTVTIAVRTRVNQRAQAPFQIVNSAEVFSDGGSSSTSTASTTIQTIPSALPSAGVSPETSLWLTTLAAALAALSPLAVWGLLRRTPHKG